MTALHGIARQRCCISLVQCLGFDKWDLAVVPIRTAQQSTAQQHAATRVAFGQSERDFLTFYTTLCPLIKTQKDTFFDGIVCCCGDCAGARVFGAGGCSNTFVGSRCLEHRASRTRLIDAVAKQQKQSSVLSEDTRVSFRSVRHPNHGPHTASEGEVGNFDPASCTQGACSLVAML